MNIYIDIYEQFTCSGRTVGVYARSRIEVNIDGCWSVPALEKFKAKLDDLLASELNGCIIKKGDPA